MSDFTPIVVDFTANAAGALSGINELITGLERLGEVATTSVAAMDEAFAGLNASNESLTAVAATAEATKKQMQGIARAGRSIGKAMDGTAASVEESMTAIGAAADKMASQVVESSDAAAVAITSLDDKSKTIGASFAAGSDEATAALARLTEASKAAAVAMDEVAASTKTSAAESSAAAESMGAKFLGLSEIGSQIKAVLPLSLAAVGYESVKMATSFQKSTTQLVTSAGESVQAIGQVRSGMLDMAASVGVKADDLSKAMYYVEAAGFHAADGLTVLKAAAQGAAAEGADTTTVAQALTDVLVDYHMKASSAADITSKMIEAVAHGKTNLQDFAGSFASIVPAASAAGISFDDVGAALANMTNHGFSAQRASQNLAQALRSLLNPTNKMMGAFDQYGVSAATLKEKLHGPNGLTDAMEYLSQAASKAGKEGTPEFAAALKELMGTAPGANAALATVGANFKATSDTIVAMGNASADAKGRVQGFALVQQTLGFQLKQIRAGFDSVMIKLGDGLIPVLSKAITLVEKGASPAFHGLASALSGITSGFTGKAGQAPPAPHFHSAGMNAIALEDARAATPQLTGWQKVGEVLRGAADDFKRFGSDVATAFRNLAQAAGPTLQMLGSALLGALRAVASILASVVGPALVKVTGFMNQNKTAVRDLVAVALVPLALRLGALAVIKPIGVVARLAKDIVTFPFSQAKQLWADLKGGIDSAVATAGKIKEVVGNGLVAVARVAGTAWRGAKTALSAIGDGAMTLGGKLKDAGSNALALASNIGKAAAAGAKSAWSGLISGLQAVGSAAKAAALAALDLGRKTLTTGIIAARSAIAWVAEKVALVASAVAEKAAAAAQWLLDAAMDANPIGLIIIAIAALVAALVYCWTHFKTFRDIVKDALKAVEVVVTWLWKSVIKPAFDGIAAAVSWVIDFVKAHWPLLLAILTGPIGIAVYLIVKYWGQIKEGFSAAWNAIRSAASTALHWVAGLPSMILRALGNVGSLLYNAGKNIIIGLWNGLASMGSWIASNIMSLIQSVVPGPVLKILGINSPSRVFHEIGLGVTEGLVNGLTAGAPNAARASAQMAHAVIGSASGMTVGSGSLASLAAGAASTAAAAGQGTLQPIVVQVDGRTLFQIMQTQALRYGRRNPTTGLTYTTS